MKITLSAAMRARDVSRPRPEQLAEAAAREEPRAASEEPRAASEEPRAASEEPRAASEEPRAARRDAAPEEAQPRGRRRRRPRAR